MPFLLSALAHLSAGRPTNLTDIPFHLFPSPRSNACRPTYLSQGVTMYPG